MTLTQADYRPAGEWSVAELDALQGTTEPRVGTPRYEGLRSHGRVLSAFDDLFGFELMPWQVLTADRAMQLTPAGQWLHATVAAVVARQNGKTTLAARRILAGLYLLGDFGIIHLAQDRALPREVFSEVATLISDTTDLNKHLAKRGGLRFTNGQEQIKLRDGSNYRILAPNEGAVRGYQRIGLVLFDEVRTQQTLAVWSAVQYTQRAHPNPTRWAISNAGDPDSVLLNGLRDRGRTAAEQPDTDKSMCWLEWSADPECAIDDPRHWPDANPALGRTLHGSTLLEELRSDEPDNFRTEALCQWVDTTTAQAIPWELWQECADRDLKMFTPDDDLRVWLAIDIDPEREHAALMIAAEVDDLLVVAMHRQWTGTECDEAAIAADVADLWEQWNAQGIGYDPHTCGGVVDRKPDLPWEQVTGADWVVACGQLLDAVQGATLVHADQHDLNAQLSVAGRRDFGDGTWRISRKDSTHPIPAVVAMARVVHLTAQPGGVGITVL